MAIAKRAGNWRERRHTKIEGETRTQQSHRDSSDVNNIVRRFQQTGDMPRNPRGIEGQYMDCTPFQEPLTDAYNDAVERQAEIEADIEQRRAEALEAAKKPVDRDPEDAPPADPPESSD